MKLYTLPTLTMLICSLSVFGMEVNNECPQKDAGNYEALKAKTQAEAYWTHVNDFVVVSAALKETCRKTQPYVAVQAFGDYEAYKHAMMHQASH